MKKILVLAIAVALLASMAVPAAAGAGTQGRGGIQFGLLPPGEVPPSLGGHDPTPEGDNPFPGPYPAPMWPEWPTVAGPMPGNADTSIFPRTPTAMDSINLDFGPRSMPTGAHGMRGWTSAPVGAWHEFHTAQGLPVTDPNNRRAPDPGTIPNLTTDPLNPLFDDYVDHSYLGLLWNQGATATVGPPPGYAVQVAANHTINAQLGFFYLDGSVLPTARTLGGFDLTLRPARTPGFVAILPDRNPTAPTQPGRHTVGAPLTGGEVSGFTREGITVLDPGALSQPPTAADTWGAARSLVHFQSGFMGIEWVGLLEGNWIGSNVRRGDAQAYILFTHELNAIPFGS